MARSTNYPPLIITLPPKLFSTRLSSRTSAHSTDQRAQAFAARTAARERRLREHPHADVRGPELIVCRLCQRDIKLSTKSAYDGFHWNKHIERCQRRTPAGRAQRVQRAAELVSSRGLRSSFSFFLPTTHH